MSAAFTNTFWTLVPSITAIVLALIIREPHVSLFIGAFFAALLVAGLQPVTAIHMFITDGVMTAISENAGIITFVVILGVIINILNMTNGSAAFGRWSAKHIKTQTGAMFATFVLGILIFIDDMFNCFTVATVMMPVTDRNKMSRQKLAYLLDATAAPICMIAPISSWGAAVSSTAEGLGTGMKGIQLFIKAIPFNFYSLLTLIFIIVIGIMKFDYGKMRKYQEEALKGDLGEVKNNDKTTKDNALEGKIIDLIIPIGVMMVVCTTSMMYIGGFFDAASENFHSIAGSFANTDGAVALSIGGIVTLVFTVIYSMLRKTMNLKNVTDCIFGSFKIAGSPLVILILAVSLKNLTLTMGIREYISMVMQNTASGLYRMLPAVIFIIACFVAFASGTSWGTFGILIPIVTAIFPVDSTLLIIGISACLAGAVCGDHCSPISDTTIMSSAAAQCEHVTHVETQLPYVITVAAISFVTYIVAGFVQNAVICLIVGVVLVVATLTVIRKVEQSRVINN